MPNRFIDFLDKNGFEANSQYYSDWYHKQNYVNQVGNDRWQLWDDMWWRWDLQTMEDNLDMMEDNLGRMEDNLDRIEDSQNSSIPLY